MGGRLPDPQRAARLGSGALVADGHHARIDGLTSLAVGVVGVALGWESADPIVGLLISVAIMRIVWTSLRAIGLRAMDGVESGTVDAIETEASVVAGVEDVRDVCVRWWGHALRAEVTVTVDAGATVREGNDIASRLRAALVERGRPPRRRGGADPRRPAQRGAGTTRLTPSLRATAGVGTHRRAEAARRTLGP